MEVKSTVLNTKVLKYDLSSHNMPMEKSRNDPSLFFADGNRRIDMVLAYENGIEDQMEKISRYRQIFEDNLKKAGLDLELEDKASSFDEKTYFLKVHAPAELLEKNGNILSMKKHTTQFYVTQCNMDQGLARMVQQTKSDLRLTDRSRYTVPSEPKIFNPGLLPGITDKYVLKRRACHWSSMQRTQIVWQILNRALYENSAREKAGIERLLTKKVYTAAYALHEGDYDYGKKRLNILYTNERMLLYDEWASLRNWHKSQPLWLIRKYFGIKIGLYFAWLGFYTKALILPALVGIFSITFGLLSMNTSLNQASLDICNITRLGNVTMCPQCDNHCPYWKLMNSCLLSKVTYLFDNHASIVYTIFMTFWATAYLELWKRQQAILQWEWDLKSEEEMDDTIRPEFEQRVKTSRYNPINQKREPYVSTREKILRMTLSSGIVLLMLTCVIGAVSSLILFRVIMIRYMYKQIQADSFFSKYAKLIATAIAATINALVIEVSGWIFQYIARRITNWEHPRTQSEYENSYTFKMFLFQFINYYSSLIYTAFFKGRFFTHPGDVEARQNTFTLLRTDVCDPAGCLFELCLMLTIYMIGRQLASNTVELYFPILKNWFRGIWFKYRSKHFGDGTTKAKQKLQRWEKDYQLEEIDRLHLFDEYIEIIVQYGFVTLFVAAFPLAPLLALINNIFEIRLDAFKYTTQMRRPFGQHVRTIGIWFGILKGITYLSVVFNAFIVALASDFIPRVVHVFVYSDDWSLNGYLNSTLAEFNVSDWGPADSATYYGPGSVGQIEICRYRAYRSPPRSFEEYEINKTWLHVFAARLGFVAVFEHMILVMTAILAYAIPDVPKNLQTQSIRERHQEREIDFNMNQS